MKILYKVLFLWLLFASCKMATNEDIRMQKKANILEHTKWKASGVSMYEGDSVLDFHTSDSVVEYIELNGITKTGRRGSYKVKNRILEIKWSKLKSDRVSGPILGNEIKLEGKDFKTTTIYYKIDEY